MLSILGIDWRPRGGVLKTKSLLFELLELRKMEDLDLEMPDFADLLDPFLFRDMRKAVDRIEKAIVEKEKVLLFGDYDADGMSGVAELYLAIKHLGGSPLLRLPARSEGYGLSSATIEFANAKKVSLIITADCGISNGKEIEMAAALGIDVIITDHHSVPEKIPEAFAILHPLLPGESFPDKFLTGAGVAFFLSKALLENRLGKGPSSCLLPQIIELAVIGTIADVGMLVQENRSIAMLGLQSMKKTKHPGLRALMDISGISPHELNAERIAFSLAPRLNASGRLAHPMTSLELLVGNPEKAGELESLNRQRQSMVDSLFEEAERMISAKDPLSAVIVGSESWPPGVLGLIAGKLVEKFGVPAVVVGMSEQKFVASLRSTEDFHITKALQEISGKDAAMFFSFGGHKEAAGFSMPPEKYPVFQKLFSEIAKRERGFPPPPPSITYDGEILRKISIEEVAELQKLEPCGMGNPSPLFLFPRLSVLSLRTVGSEGKHLSMKLKSDAGQLFSGIFFQSGRLHDAIASAETIDVLASPEIHIWRDTMEIQLKIKDLRPSRAPSR